MRVVVVVSSFPKLSQTFVVNKVLGLLDAGVDVQVICRTSDPAEWEWFEQLRSRPEVRARVHVDRIGRNPLKAVRAAVHLLAGALRRPRPTFRYLASRARARGSGGIRLALLDGWFFALRPDVIHFEFGSEAVGRVGLKRALGCRLTVSFRGFDLNFVGLEDPAYFDGLWEQVDAIHCLGEDLWRRALRRGCPPDRRVVLIPPAIDTSYFAPRSRSAEAVGTAARPLRILSVGRLHWKKGYPDGIAAIKHVRGLGVVAEYRVVGRGPAEDEVRACIRDLGVETQVTLLGALARADVRDQLQWADVLLHPAVSEGFANAVLEAQAMEVPVVCTDADGLGENVVHGETGFVVPRRCPVRLAEALARLAADAALRRQLGAAGRARAVTSFSPEAQIVAFRRFYEDVGARPATHGQL